MMEASPTTNIKKSLSVSTNNRIKVFIEEEDGDQYYHAISSRAFNGRGIPEVGSDKIVSSKANLPCAICQVCTVEEIQQVVQYCSQNNLQISVRSGGHNWHTSWLRDGSQQYILLDVGDINDINVVPRKQEDDHSFTAVEQTVVVEAGPGASGYDLLRKIPSTTFFPTGHCPSVPVGGFLVGGGYGLGLHRYGLSCRYIKKVQVVLPSGEMMEVHRNTDDNDQNNFANMIFQLLHGSYRGFPAVITKYTLQLIKRPKGVYDASHIFPMKEWKRAMEIILDYTYNKENIYASMVETGLVFCYAIESPHVPIVVLSFRIWADTQQEGLDIWNDFISNYITEHDIQKLLMPLEESPPLVDATDVPKRLEPFYPKGYRYETQVHAGNQEIYSMATEEICTLIQPLADTWLLPASDEDSSVSLSTPKLQLPSPRSLSLIIPLPPSFKHNNKLVTGDTPSLLVHTYAIHEDSSLDTQMKQVLVDAHSNMSNHPHFSTGMVEGNTTTGSIKECFTNSASWKTYQSMVHQIDPRSMFGCHE